MKNNWLDLFDERFFNQSWWDDGRDILESGLAEFANEMTDEGTYTIAIYLLYHLLRTGKAKIVMSTYDPDSDEYIINEPTENSYVSIEADSLSIVNGLLDIEITKESGHKFNRG